MESVCKAGQGWNTVGVQERYLGWLVIVTDTCKYYG